MADDKGGTRKARDLVRSRATLHAAAFARPSTPQRACNYGGNSSQRPDREGDKRNPSAAGIAGEAGVFGAGALVGEIEQADAIVVREIVDQRFAAGMRKEPENGKRTGGLRLA